MLNMRTVAENIIDELAQKKGELIDFLSSHTRVKQTIFPDDNFISVKGNYSYEKLNSEAVHLQDKLFKSFNKVFEIIEVLLSESPKEHLMNVNHEKKVILDSILQNERTGSKTIYEVIEKCTKSINRMCSTITNLFPSRHYEPILVVDTNALYTNTELENWNFENFEKFEIVITPSVLKDLDKHKIEHKNEGVRTKALKLIKKIKEYRRRGKLTEGVPIVKGKINIRTIAKEPNFDKTLKWLDYKNEDDRLIAEFLEIMRSNGDRPVFLITDDINLQNKCEVADLPFIEPPEN
jgi:hypothetical protein